MSMVGYLFKIDCIGLLFIAFMFIAFYIILTIKFMIKKLKDYAESKKK